MLASDHLPQLVIRRHARQRFVERCRWDMRRLSREDIDRELLRMVAASRLRFGTASWKEHSGHDVGWLLELVAWCRPFHSEGEPRIARVAMPVYCRHECWHLVTVLTGRPPALALDVLPIAA